MHATKYLPATSQWVWKWHSLFMQTADPPWPGR